MKSHASLLSLVFSLLIPALGSAPLLQAQEASERAPAAGRPAEAMPPVADPRSPAPRLSEGEIVAAPERAEVPSAPLVAVLVPTEGHKARGVVTFEPLDDDQVRVTARISGLSPNAKHAIHVHEFGDVSSPDGSRAGAHFNPHGHAHGLPDSEERHPGDFGNLLADAEGGAGLVLTVRGLVLSGHEDAILGRAVIVHAGEDKGTQPSGDAGDRIAQGVIAIANPDSIQEELAVRETDEAISPAAKRQVSARPASSANSTDSELQQAAEEIGRGAERVARGTVKAVERGAEEVGTAIKKVGKKINDAVD